MPLSRRELFAFAFVSVPLALGGLPLVLYLTPYYAAASDMSLATIGFVLLLTRLGDIVTDPLIGVWSDRTPARLGRRALWIAPGLPVMAVGTIAVFDPWAALTPGYLWWAVSALYLGWTLIGIPLAAWVAERSPDYHARSRLAGARNWGGVIGALLAILAPLLISVLAANGLTAAAAESPGSLQPMLKVLAWMTVGLLCIAVPVLIKAAPQPAFRPRPRLPFKTGLRVLLANRPFRLLLLSGVCAALGWNAINALFLFYVTVWLGADASQWPLIILAYMLGQVVGTPLIVKLAPRYAKHRMLAVCSMISIAVFALTLWLERGDWMGYCAINLVTGLLAPSIAILGPSMAADVIDADELASGQQRAALFMALWGMLDKAAVALATAIMLALAQALGFDPSMPSDAATASALRYVFSLMPIGFFLISIALIWHYPLDQAGQRELRRALARGE